MLARAGDDTNEDAARGKLRDSESAVRSSFLTIDSALDRSLVQIETKALSKGGEWYARSYRQQGRLICEIHPKRGWLKIKVETSKATSAPKSLLPVGEVRRGWLQVTPRDTDLAVRFLESLVQA